MPAISKAIEKSGLVESEEGLKAISTLVATSLGAVSGGNTIKGAIAGSPAGGVELYNRQLHAQEIELIDAEAKRIMAAEGKSLSGISWQTLMAYAAGAEVGAEASAEYQAILRKISDPNNPEWEKLSYDLDRAYLAVLKLQNERVVLTWAGGKPIVAHGEKVYAFKSTVKQYLDDSLFNSISNSV
ncbi:hypothetical protein [Pseudomonas tohonis]|uniref:hypothetical protein n=1 Tax=Pseudomonas tohonis TaxID=2725477 RepID=UPI001F3E1090|nr:hypothetical protein [Pseudomonas tohonis]